MVSPNVQPDTRLNWSVVAELARPVAPAGPPAPAPCDLPCHTSGHKVRLWSLLDAWAGMNEAARHPEAVDRLKDEILDVFGAHPEAEGWYRAWRTAHPEARLC